MYLSCPGMLISSFPLKRHAAFMDMLSLVVLPVHFLCILEMFTLLYYFIISYCTMYLFLFDIVPFVFCSFFFFLNFILQIFFGINFYSAIYLATSPEWYLPPFLSI